jgi:hypothetical protein
VNRIARLWPILLSIGALLTALAIYSYPLAPSPRSEAEFEVVRPAMALEPLDLPDYGLRGGTRSGAKSKSSAVPIQKRIQYEWPEVFTIGEMQDVTVRFLDTGASLPQAAAGRARADASMPYVRRVKVLLEGSGFEFQSKLHQERLVELQPGEQFVRWGATAVPAPFHRLDFRFSTEAGDLDVRPASFQPGVRTLFGLPSWITFRVSAVSAALVNLLAVPGLMAVLGRFRKRASAPTSAA